VIVWMFRIPKTIILIASDSVGRGRVLTFDYCFTGLSVLTVKVTHRDGSWSFRWGVMYGCYAMAMTKGVNVLYITVALSDRR
jgi:hypothetical protein